MHILTSPSLFRSISEEKSAFEQASKEQRAQQEAQGPEGSQKFRPDTDLLARQARALKSGKEAWRPGWVDYGVATGVGKGED